MRILCVIAILFLASLSAAESAACDRLEATPDGTDVKMVQTYLFDCKQAPTQPGHECAPGSPMGDKRDQCI